MKKVFLVLIFLAVNLTAVFSEEGMMSDSMTSDSMMSDSMHPMAGGKIMYTNMDDAMTAAESGPTVLFFNADWCPTCQAALRDLNANLDKLGDITVILVNYDKEKALKRKYGIVYQHTFVQIGPQGEKIALWNGGGTKEIIEHVEMAKEM